MIEAVVHGLTKFAFLSHAAVTIGRQISFFQPRLQCSDHFKVVSRLKATCVAAM